MSTMPPHDLPTQPPNEESTASVATDRDPRVRPETLFSEALSGIVRYVRGVFRNASTAEVPAFVDHSESSRPYQSVDCHDSEVALAGPHAEASSESADRELARCLDLLQQANAIWQSWILKESESLQQVRVEIAQLRLEMQSRLEVQSHPELLSRPENILDKVAESISVSAAAKAAGEPLGLDFAGFPKLSSELPLIVEEVANGKADAGMFLGYLLLLRYAQPKERQRWLRPVGQAFYGWRPKTTTTADSGADFEQQLVEWVNGLCQTGVSAGGDPNRVEAVTIGVRFNSDIHVAQASAGREVSEVFGWVVKRGELILDKAAVNAQ
jgi:hypothetical protein